MKWPKCHKHLYIRIQQDNARPHIAADDTAFLEAASGTGLDIGLFCQPPNSPDLNVLDLGFFNAMQSLQQQSACRTVNELVAAVTTSFQQLETRKLNNVFLTLQKVMETIILRNGGNDYKIPHMSKQRLERNGELPVSIVVSDELFAKLQ